MPRTTHMPCHFTYRVAPVLSANDKPLLLKYEGDWVAGLIEVEERSYRGFPPFDHEEGNPFVRELNPQEGLFEKGVHLAPWYHFHEGRMVPVYVAVDESHHIVAERPCIDPENETDVIDELKKLVA